MKHFTTEKWIDFVNQAVSPKDSVEMEKHLKEGCKSCQETVSMWQRVQKSAVAEKNYQPPADTVRVVKAAFAAAGMKGPRKESRSRISVLFDSFLQPVVEGARSAATDSRQMLYRADPFQRTRHARPRAGGDVGRFGAALKRYVEVGRRVKHEVAEGDSPNHGRHPWFASRERPRFVEDVVEG